MTPGSIPSEARESLFGHAQGLPVSSPSLCESLPHSSHVELCVYPGPVSFAAVWSSPPCGCWTGKRQLCDAKLDHSSQAKEVEVDLWEPKHGFQLTAWGRRLVSPKRWRAGKGRVPLGGEPFHQQPHIKPKPCFPWCEARESSWPRPLGQQHPQVSSWSGRRGKHPATYSGAHPLKFVLFCLLAFHWSTT